jgi:release factor glutamine methyltransferase
LSSGIFAPPTPGGSAAATASPPPTLGALVRAAAASLAAAGVPEPAADARVLAQTAFGLDRAGLLAGRDARPEEGDRARYAALIARRAAREPVSRIVGRREFWSLEFGLSPATLDPRPDSETLVEAALAALDDRAARWRLLDLGTGTGCLLLALLSELPAAYGLGVDRSAAALAVARGNAGRFGLAGRAAFLAADWAAGLAGRFDLVVANPPYVATAEIAALAPEVAGFDPPAALDGGADGLDAYRAIAPALPDLLAEGGRAVLEIGAKQADAVEDLLAAAGLGPARRHRDLAGHTRALEIRRCSAKK